MKRRMYVPIVVILLATLVFVAPATQAGLLSGLLGGGSRDWDNDGHRDDTVVEVCTGDSDSGVGGLLGGLLSPVDGIGRIAYEVQESVFGSIGSFLGFDTFYVTVDVCGNEIPLDPLKVYN